MIEELKERYNLRSNHLGIFMLKNIRIMNNPVIKSFLNKRENMRSLINFFSDPSIKNRKKLDEDFQAFFFQLRFTKYINSSIRFGVIEYARKRSLYQNRFIFSLDQPLDNSDNAETLIDRIVTQNASENVTYDTLYEAMMHLSNRQYIVTILYYFHGYCDVEISKKLSVSKQAINKLRRQSLKTLNRVFDF